jgi:CRP/FNR family transcriptional regulator, dissimilatory nitrate respiration regulator
MDFFVAFYRILTTPAGPVLDLGQKRLLFQKKSGKFPPMKIDADFILKIPLFSGSQARELLKISSMRSVARGEIIFSEGDSGDGFYVVASGKIKIYMSSPEGKEKILHIFGPGQPVGEVPVFSGSRFPATAQALEASKLLFFPRDAFARLIETHPSLSMKMLGVLSRRLREFTVQIEQLSLKEVPGRLASYLIALAMEQDSREAVRLTVSKTQLAGLLGTIPETLSRIFSKMTDQGLIDVSGKQIRIHDYEGLAALAEQGRILL